MKPGRWKIRAGKAVVDVPVQIQSLSGWKGQLFMDQRKVTIIYFLFLYFSGVVPVMSAKTFLKWFSELKPTKRLMVATE